MTRRLLPRAFLPGVSLGVLMLVAGCGGGGGSSNTTPPPNNNPVPAISSISPTSATAGAAAQTLTINGSNFITTSSVTYNGTAHTATYVSASQLTIQLTTGDQATAGTFAVVVTNPSPGGGSSNSVNFTVNNPTPAISTLSPSSATAGAAAQTLTINGSNFVSTSTVKYNGTAHAATLVSAAQITIQLTTGDQATAGDFPVVVTNPAPGGGASNSVNFVVNASNPVPNISSLAPSSATAGHAAQTLQINGTGFLSTSTVTYNGVGHTASFVSSTELTISLTAADQLSAGDYPVVVTNPTPGGGHSNSVNFDVTSGISILISNPASPASVNVGSTLPITVSVTGATASVTWTVNGASNGNSTYGTITGSYPSFTYTPPSVIPGSTNPVTLEASQTGAAGPASLSVMIKGSTTAATAIAVTGGASAASGIDFSLSANSSLTLGVSNVGSCGAPNPGGGCLASVSGIQISASGSATSTCPNATCTIWLLGQGLSNSGGTVITTSLVVKITEASTSDVNVGTVSAGPVAGGLTGISFPITVSPTATHGLRDVVVVLPNGESAVYLGAIQIVN